MALDTDLNIDPYFDDFDETKNFHRIMFRPAVPVQARELTQLQTILQNQIERFGDNIFAEGTIIKGCNFIFDSAYYYVKLPDLRVDGQTTNPNQFVGYRAIAATSNLQAIVINSVIGLESQTPDLNTIFVKYLNSGTSGEKQFLADDQLTFYSNTNPEDTASIVAEYTMRVANSTFSPVGNGYSFGVSEGIVFQKGFFIRVANNITSIVSKYNSAPNNVSVGFITTEEIIDELQDPSLADNASGYTNANAPGANRLKLTPSLFVANTDALPSNNFFSLVEWQNGSPVRLKQQTEYSTLGRELARRTFEESGNYVVDPFSLSTEAANTTYFNSVTSKGLAFVEGYRVENSENLRVPVRKGTDTRTDLSQFLGVNYGNYVYVNEFLGNFDFGATISLRDTAAQNITDESRVITAPGSEIGTARLLSMAYDTGTPGTPLGQYRLYLTDIKMNTGKNFTSVRAVSYDGAAVNDGLADLVLENGDAVLKDSNLSSLVIPTTKTAVSTLSNINYIYRTNSSNASFNISASNGSLVGAGLAAGYQFPYGAATLNSVQERAIIVMPTSSANVATPAKSGTVMVNNAIVTGTGTAFLAQYDINDYISINSQIRRIASIANNTLLNLSSTTSNVAAGNSHAKTYPAYIPLAIAERNTLITANTTALTLQLVSKEGTNETLSANLDVVLTYDVQKSTASAIPKSVYKDQYIKIDTTYFLGGAGTLSCNTSSATVTGYSGTTFSASILPNYLLYDPANNLIGTVQSVASATSLTLTTNALLVRSNTAYAFSAPRSVGPSGPWSLGMPDVYKIENIYKSSSNVYSESSADDVTTYFTLSTGQKDGIYDLATISLSPLAIGQISNGDKFLVKFDTFVQNRTSGIGFFNKNSYAIDDANTANTIAITTINIPVFTSSTGQKFDLKDSFDFRPQVSPTASLAATAAAANINPSSTSSFPAGELYIVSPEQSFQYDVTYYIGRIDKLVINSTGSFKVIEGVPSERPSIPYDVKNTMTLATLTIPPYPTLTMAENIAAKRDEYSVKTTTHQTKRYTMFDISKIDRRVQAVEYYTSLNLLEVNSKDLVIKSDITGNDRFKNGFFVDSFNDSTLAQTDDNEFMAGYDKENSAIIPQFQQTVIPLINSETNDLITLTPTEALFITQPKSSKNRQCADVTWNYLNAVISCSPPMSLTDIRYPPVPIDDTPVVQPPADPIPVVTITPTPAPDVPLPPPTPAPPPPQPALYRPNQLDVTFYSTVLNSSPYVQTPVFTALDALVPSTGTTYRSYIAAYGDPVAGVTLPGSFTTGITTISNYPFSYFDSKFNYMYDALFSKFGFNVSIQQGSRHGKSAKNTKGQLAMRWTGKIKVPETGTWTFYGTYDDGMVLYVNRTLVINAWGDGSARSSSGALSLTAGVYYDFEMYYFNDSSTGDAALVLEAAGPTIARGVVPYSYFFIPSASVTATTKATPTPGVSIITSGAVATPPPTTQEIIPTIISIPNFNVAAPSVSAPMTAIAAKYGERGGWNK